jgi:hypothetical protein
MPETFQMHGKCAKKCYINKSSSKPHSTLKLSQDAGGLEGDVKLEDHFDALFDEEDPIELD